MMSNIPKVINNLILVSLLLIKNDRSSLIEWLLLRNRKGGDMECFGKNLFKPKLMIKTTTAKVSNLMNISSVMGPHTRYRKLCNIFEISNEYNESAAFVG